MDYKSLHPVQARNGGVQLPLHIQDPLHPNLHDRHPVVKRKVGRGRENPRRARSAARPARKFDLTGCVSVIILGFRFHFIRTSGT